jgi:diguanylate cyclase (GGDEF)-like protein
VMNELELRVTATTDPLTGALSRRGFREVAERAVALAIRHRHDLSLLMLDLDHFKAVNDKHGHATGDVVLAETVQTCRTLLRKSDAIGRLGGEEFAMLLPYTGRAAALEVAEKLRGALARQQHQAITGPFTVTASIGAVSLERSATDVDTLLARADEALYAAKNDGRNRCVTWARKEAAEPASRRRVFKAGRISFNGGRSAIDCTVRSLSETGAGIDVVSAAGVPDEFKLQIEADHFSQLCRVTQKSAKHLDIEFA